MISRLGTLMCGICGIVELAGAAQPSPADVQSMSTLLSHRGPDAHGHWCNGAVGLGHRRLSVIDLEGSLQPMTTADGRHAIVFNGEIYNYRQLRETLRGTVFRTNGDTETLLCLATSDRADWLDSLIGMFAFAVWDSQKQQLRLVRDRLGIKPLYYRTVGGRFYFASEAKALARVGGATAEANAAAVGEYMAFRNIAGEETLFAGVREVPPGHVLTLDANSGKLEIAAYWRDEVMAREPSERGFADDSKLADFVSDAIRYRLVADVPIGTYNSGGIDSSLVTHFVRGMMSGELHTFSVGFHENGYDESAFAEQVAAQVGSEHHKLLVGAEEYAENLPLTIWHNDEPLHHAHTVQLLLLSREAKRYVTVVLTGEGADELFAGYPRYQIPLLSRSLSWLPGGLFSGLHEMFQSAGLRRLAKLSEIAGGVDQSVVEQARFATRRSLAALGGDRPIRRRALRCLDGVGGWRRTVSGEGLGIRSAHLPAVAIAET